MKLNLACHKLRQFCLTLGNLTTLIHPQELCCIPSPSSYLQLLPPIGQPSLYHHLQIDTIICTLEFLLHTMSILNQQERSPIKQLSLTAPHLSHTSRTPTCSSNSFQGHPIYKIALPQLCITSFVTFSIFAFCKHITSPIHFCSMLSFNDLFVISLINFFLISNKILLIRKQETSKHTGSIQGRANQERKLQKSSKSKREKEWFLKTENHSSKVRKKRSLMSGLKWLGLKIYQSLIRRGKKKGKSKRGSRNFFFLIRNENFVDQKRKHPCMPGVYLGSSTINLSNYSAQAYLEIRTGKRFKSNTLIQ